MPKLQHEVEIANVTIKFGEELNLLDMFDETVKPAFFSGFKRTFGQTKYFFHQVEVVTLDASLPVVGIVGRFVKDTVLEREQIYEDGDLVNATGELASSPSSVFLLILNSHRLLFLREHRGSPPISAFETTLARFLKKSHQAFVRSRAREKDPETGKRLLKADVLKLYPYPEVEIMPIASEESMEKFIQRFKTLELVKIRLLPTNSELDNDPLFKKLRSGGERIKSTATVLNYENKKGLNKSEAVSQMAAAAKQGNHQFRLVGHESTGEKLIGNNEHFKVQIPIDKLPSAVKDAASKLFTVFQNLVEKSVIALPKVAHESAEKIKKLFSSTTDDT